MFRLMDLFQKRAIVVWGITILVAGLSIPLNNTVYAAEKPDAFEEYISYGNYFKCLLPKGWSRNEAPDSSRDASKVYGIEVYQGRSEHRIGISVKYYAADNKLHKSAEKFIGTHSRPLFGGPETEGEKYGPVEEILIKGVKARIFERERYDFEDHVITRYPEDTMSRYPPGSSQWLKGLLSYRLKRVFMCCDSKPLRIQ